MEGATATISLKLTSDFLCPDCQRLFDKARVLSCGHSVCLKCIRQRCETRSSNTQEVTCPTCKCGTLVPSSGLGEDFPENHSLTSVMNILKLTPEVQQLEKHATGNGGKKLSQGKMNKDIQRFSQMLQQLEKDFVEITNLKENANTAIQTLSLNRQQVNQRINETAEQFLEKVTSDVACQRDKLITSVQESYKEKVTVSIFYTFHFHTSSNYSVVTTG